ncbi:MAG: L,D-transpeptidase family protein [Pseudomonadota bacterium]
MTSYLRSAAFARFGAPLALAGVIFAGDALATETKPIEVDGVAAVADASPELGPELSPKLSPRALPGLLELLKSTEEDAETLDWFYAARGYEPIWSKGRGVISPGAARALIAAVEGAEAHALPSSAYDLAALEDTLKRPWDASAEILFAKTYLQLARDLNSGMLEPRRLSRNMDVRPVRPDPLTLLKTLENARDVDSALNQLGPQDADYRALVAVYAEMRVLAETPEIWGPKVAEGRTLRIGDHGRRVLALRERLRAMGDLPSALSVETETRLEIAAADVTADVPIDTGAPDAARFDLVLEDAVKRFQARHGLNEDGVVGPATLGALNASPAFRAKQIAVNLERARWNHTRMNGPRIVSNLPDYRAKLYREGPEPVFETRVVIGKYRHQTVEFSDEMDHMVVNPTWFVPSSIARNEILPKLRENPNYLAERNMRLVGADPAEILWEFVEPEDFPGRVRQAPGPGNALGRVKFMFPNHHAIYLHDTPQRSLFRRDNRAYSHGCVRVEQPAELAAHLLEGQVDDPAGSFETWVRRGRERHVSLDQKLPVHLVYRTAWQDADGAMHFRRDVYRRDALVASALEKRGLTLPGS